MKEKIKHIDLNDYSQHVIVYHKTILTPEEIQEKLIKISMIPKKYFNK